MRVSQAKTTSNLGSGEITKSRPARGVVTPLCSLCSPHQSGPQAEEVTTPGAGGEGESIYPAWRSIQTGGMKPTSAIRQPAAPDTPELRLELTCDDEPLVYCLGCWEREFGEAG